MTDPHDDPTPVEHDPTGMRALLAGLPDPGPMPPDLVARITAALAAEVDAGAGPPASVPAPPSDAGSHGATVVPLRRRRVRLRHLGVAAAVVAAVGLGGVLLSTTPNSLTASIGAAGGSADSAASAGKAESAVPNRAGSAGAAAGLVPRPGSGAVVVVTSGRSYTAAALAEGARALLAGPAPALRTLAAESPAIGPIGSPLGARACADALGVPADAGVLVDLADVDGRPGAVLVVDTGAARTAYAVERSCTSGRTGPVRGPVSLD